MTALHSQTTLSADDPGCADALRLVQRLNALLDRLCTKGLRALSSEDLSGLRAQVQELEVIGATTLAEQLAALADQIGDGQRSAAVAACRFRAAVRVFERLLSLRMVEAAMGRAMDYQPDHEH